MAREADIREGGSRSRSAIRRKGMMLEASTILQK